MSAEIYSLYRKRPTRRGWCLCDMKPVCLWRRERKLGCRDPRCYVGTVDVRLPSCSWRHWTACSRLRWCPATHLLRCTCRWKLKRQGEACIICTFYESELKRRCLEGMVTGSIDAGSLCRPKRQVRQGNYNYNCVPFSTGKRDRWKRLTQNRFLHRKEGQVKQTDTKCLFERGREVDERDWR